MSVINNFLTDVELAYINNLPEVIEAKTRLGSSGKVYFSIELTETIRNVLHEKFGLEFSGSTIPMRWIKGDTSPHIDSGASKFEKTHLVYLNDSPGTFLIGNETYDILGNTGYVFNEGITHSTQNTGTVPRLLMGPMNEFAEPVGTAVVVPPVLNDYWREYAICLRLLREYDAGTKQLNIVGFTESQWILSEQTSLAIGTPIVFSNNVGGVTPGTVYYIRDVYDRNFGIADSSNNEVDPSGSITLPIKQVTNDFGGGYIIRITLYSSTSGINSGTDSLDGSHLTGTDFGDYHNVRSIVDDRTIEYYQDNNDDLPETFDDGVGGTLSYDYEDGNGYTQTWNPNVQSSTNEYGDHNLIRIVVLSAAPTQLQLGDEIVLTSLPGPNDGSYRIKTISEDRLTIEVYLSYYNLYTNTTGTITLDYGGIGTATYGWTQYYSNLLETIRSKFTNVKGLLQDSLQYGQDPSLVFSEIYTKSELTRFLKDFSLWVPQCGNFGYDLANTRRSPYTPYGIIGHSGYYAASSSPIKSLGIGADGTIYFGTDNTLFAINPALLDLTGSAGVKWSFSISGPSHPAIGPDGTIYVGSSDTSLYAINPDGTHKWSYLTNDATLSSPIIGSDGTIYFTTYSIWAINPDGTQKWSSGLNDSSQYSPAIGPDGTVYCTGGNSTYAVNPIDGSIKWEFASPNDGLWTNSVISPDGIAYVGSNDGFVNAFNTDGSVLWTFTTMGSPKCLALGSNGILYVGDSEGFLYGLDAHTGLQVYFPNYNGSDFPVGSILCMTIAGNGHVYVGTSNFFIDYNSILTYQDSGDPPSDQADSYPTSSMCIGANNVMYTGSYGNLYALSDTYCFLGFVKLSTSTGPVAIENIQPGTLMLQPNGTYSKAINISRSTVSAPHRNTRLFSDESGKCVVTYWHRLRVGDQEEVRAIDNTLLHEVTRKFPFDIFNIELEEDIHKLMVADTEIVAEGLIYDNPLNNDCEN